MCASLVSRLTSTECSFPGHTRPATRTCVKGLAGEVQVQQIFRRQSLLVALLHLPKVPNSPGGRWLSWCWVESLHEKKKETMSHTRSALPLELRTPPTLGLSFLELLRPVSFFEYISWKNHPSPCSLDPSPHHSVVVVRHPVRPQPACGRSATRVDSSRSISSRRSGRKRPRTSDAGGRAKD